MADGPKGFFNSNKAINKNKFCKIFRKNNKNTK